MGFTLVKTHNSVTRKYRENVETKQIEEKKKLWEKCIKK